jgi:ParB-like chromosome segregation protein Spo0J
MTDARRRLELVPLSAITGADKNPKRHASEQLGTSIDRFGYVEPVVIDERTGRLVAGHGASKRSESHGTRGKLRPMG